MGLALASRLVSRKESLSGRFKLLFQPAEEGVRGGRAMTEKGHLDDVDFLFGLHLAGEFASGVVGAGCSDFLCTTKVDAFFRGVAAHAGMAPNEGRNALLAAATAVLGLHSIASHREGASRINVGLLRAGTGRNVVPEGAELFFETRGRTSAIDRYVYERALEVLDGAARTQGVTVESRLAGGAVDARSHPDLVALVAEKALAIDGIGHVEREGRIGGSEDISWMMRRVEERGGKACYFIVGADRTAGHHQGRFDFDEAVLPRGVALLAALAEAVGGGRG
jgi:aminobenzoyl-glutamate utilization protein A